MKRLVVLSGVLILAGLGALALLLPQRESAAPANPPPAKRPIAPPPTSATIDPAEVFQRAFWKRPSPEDRILHAERREWSDDGSLQQWQWFIVVEPSPALVKHLRDDNAFNLVAGGDPGEIPGAPAWFAPPSAGGDILQAPTGNLRLIFSKTTHLLYACDSGKGFRSGAPEPAPAPAPPSPSPAGRLPNHPPPDPSDR